MNGMSIVSSPASRWAAHAVWTTSHGATTFGADAARALVRAVQALPAAERLDAWRALDLVTETDLPHARSPDGTFSVVVHVDPVSRPDADAAAILTAAANAD